MAASTMIVPGTNDTLLLVARQLQARADEVPLRVLDSANDVLWQARQQPPDLVVSAVQLSDMSGAELAEILPNFAPQARIVVCGTATPPIAAQIRNVGAEFIELRGTLDQQLETIYNLLGLEMPAPQPALVAATPEAAPAATPGTRPFASQPQPDARPADRFDNTKAFVIQPQQYTLLTKLLDLIAKEVHAQCALLIDSAGMVLVRSGDLPNVVMELVGPMLATSFSSTGQLARLLQEQQSNAVFIHEGDRYDLYAFNVAGRVSLLIMFDKKIEPGKLGTVWVYAKRATRQIQQILKL